MNKEFIDVDENFYSVLLNKAVATKKALEIKIKLFSIVIALFSENQYFLIDIISFMIIFMVRIGNLCGTVTLDFFVRVFLRIQLKSFSK